MDPSIERKFIVYAVRGGALYSCPAEDPAAFAGEAVVFAGSQQQCERYMRDITRLRWVALDQSTMKGT